MIATVLFVQGAGNMHDPEGSIHLARYLERELGDDVRVLAPEMPDAENPAYEPWRAAIEKELVAIEGPILIVGHSLGASTVLKVLSESSAPRVDGLFLVTTPWWEPVGWSAEYAVGEGFPDRLPDVPIYLYHSVDDPEVPFSHLAIYRRHLPAATARAIPGREHSFVHGLPELVADIRSVAAALAPTTQVRR
jgi:predicted alpha/beta hydrolase family esterase